MSLSPPPLNDSAGFSPMWRVWFSQLFDVARPASGTTAQRPVKGLYPGKPYFDTSLGANGKMIWVNKTASGWVDGSGATV